MENEEVSIFVFLFDVPKFRVLYSRLGEWAEWGGWRCVGEVGRRARAYAGRVWGVSRGVCVGVCVGGSVLGQ